jgi:hypothetical protein
MKCTDNFIKKGRIRPLNSGRGTQSERSFRILGQLHRFLISRPTLTCSLLCRREMFLPLENFIAKKIAAQRADPDADPGKWLQAACILFHLLSLYVAAVCRSIVFSHGFDPFILPTFIVPDLREWTACDRPFHVVILYYFYTLVFMYHS